ncbi:hypothetical protein [Acrocarpospora sp. B8E8]|uniref:hypothetical protein n=1 Tax=Acrocarpospora sp. B8E8 TaxID=3153572 RepID=UPI00325E4CC4
MFDERNKKLQGFVFNSVLSAGGLVVPGAVAGQVVWLAVTTGFSAKDAFGSAEATRVGKLNADIGNATLGRQHTFAQMLMSNGVTPKVTPADFQAAEPQLVGVANENGDLKPFSELLKQGNRGLEAFEKWATANGMGNADRLSVGNLSEVMAGWFEGSQTRGMLRAGAYDR